MPNLKHRVFPKGFKFGAATASHQIEGAWNIEGKSENIWDRMCHQNPDSIKNRDNADDACHSYHKYEEDIKLLKHIGVDYYRFSISWSRILPTGFVNKINADGIKYYNNLINALIAEGIEPMATMLHFDLPQAMQELGGFQNEAVIDYFVDYARVLFENFGDRVKTWFTFNEPWMMSELGYGGIGMAPRGHSPGVGVYLCGQNFLKAHAKTYHLYNDHFRKTQQGRITIVLHWFGFIPHDDTPEAAALAEKMKQFKFGWFAHPIFSKEGDYPQIMKDEIAKRSAEQGLSKSRLPELGKYWVDLIRGSGDFIAINTYTTFVARPKTGGMGFSWENDVQGTMNNDNLGWPESGAVWLKENAVEFGNMFRWMKKQYGDREIVISENGWPGDGAEKLDEGDRIRYLTRYLSELLKAIYEDKINITAYTYWSLMDNFEWVDGYSLRFGLYHVDFQHPDRPRRLKKSGEFYRQVLLNRKLPDESNTKTSVAAADRFEPRLNRHPSEVGLPMFSARLD